MGAQEWQCSIPYQTDVTQALAEAQRQVFKRGEYRRPNADIDFLHLIGFLDATPQEQEGMLSAGGLTALRPLIAQVGTHGLRRRLQELQEAPALEMLEDLRALNCLSTAGTESILDISRTTVSPKSGTVSPFTLEELRQHYGTERPTRADINATSMDLFRSMGRGEGRYLVLYEAGQPSEILFVGYSYD